MMLRSGLITLIAALAVVVGPVRGAESDAGPSAAERFAEGSALLAEADFDSALQAFADAAKADPKNTEYRQLFALTRQVMKLRGALPHEPNAQRWDQIAVALRAFYYEYGVYEEALSLDEQRYGRRGLPTIAAQLAESQLEVGLNAEAVDTLRHVEKADLPPRGVALLGVALAREGKTEEAEAVARRFQMPEAPDAALLMDLACLHALLGDQEMAAKLLTQSFEQTLPSRLTARKEYAMMRADLASLLESAEYETVWTTASLIKESSCSGGTSCGSCPSKSSCGSGK